MILSSKTQENSQCNSDCSGLKILLISPARGIGSLVVFIAAKVLIGLKKIK